MVGGFIVGSNVVVRVRRIWWCDADKTPPANQNLYFDLTLYVPTVTNPFSGPVTPAPYDLGDAASACTLAYTGQSQPFTSSTSKVLWSGACNVFNGLETWFDIDNGPVALPTYAIGFNLSENPNGSVAWYGGIEWEEIG
jgi:hypothetical protein